MDTQSSNDSVFSGGDNAVITKVMGGGGFVANGGGEGVAPPGYNDTQTVFDPDIGGKEAELIMVTGGGSLNTVLDGGVKMQRNKLRPKMIRKPLRKVMRPMQPTPPGSPMQPVVTQQVVTPPVVTQQVVTQQVVTQPVVTQPVVTPTIQEKNIRIIKNYAQKGNLIKYNDFITKIQSKKGQIITSLEALLNKEQKDLHYALNNGILEKNTVPSEQLANNERIKFIPLNTKELIILPETNTGKEFFDIYEFLIKNKYLFVTSTNDFKIKKNIFIVHLKISEDATVKYFYLKLKTINPENYYIANEPYKIVYPVAIDGEKGLYIHNGDINNTTISTPKNAKDIGPGKDFFETIQQYFINKLSYAKSQNNYDDTNFSIIKFGATDTDDTSDYNIDIKKNIVIIFLKNQDIPTVDVDIGGKLYRIRVAYGVNDSVYSKWLNSKFTKDEKELIKDLHIKDMYYQSGHPYFDIRFEKTAEILYQLSLFKCFNDESLLLKSECNNLRKTLQELYKYSLDNNLYDE